MSNRRYHIHVICVAHEQPLVLERVAIFFQARAFLTYDISSRLPQAALYSRQCIDACDYTLVIVGTSYGFAHQSAASQMHLSYLNAKAKLKPMLIFVKAHDDSIDVSRQLQDFTRLLEQQTCDIHYYDDHTNIDQLLSYAYEDMIVRNAASGWVYNTSTDKTMQNLNTTANASSNKHTEKSDSFDSVTKELKLTDTFEIQYSAQAYEGGNVTDVTMRTLVTWQQILQTIVKIPASFSTFILQIHINRLIIPIAEGDIKQLMPNVHVVSRCQINQSDLLKLQRLLVAANWIELTATGAREKKELWKLTFYAHHLFEESMSSNLDSSIPNNSSISKSSSSVSESKKNTALIFKKQE